MSLQLGLGKFLWLLPALGEQLTWSPVGLCLYSGCSQVSAFPLGMGEVGTAHGISSTGALVCHLLGKTQHCNSHLSAYSQRPRGAGKWIWP